MQTLTIKPEFHDPSAEAFLRIYEPGQSGTWYSGRLSSKFSVSLPPTRTLCVWLYVKRVFKEDRHLDAKSTTAGGVGLSGGGIDARIELEEDTIARVGTGVAATSFDIVDIEGVKVASAQCSGDFKSAARRDTGSGARWLAKVTAVTPKETNVTELPLHVFGSVQMPYSTVPMWGYALLGARRAAKASMLSTLEASFSQACWFMRFDPKDFGSQPIDTQLETLCEMQTIAPRLVVYARDTSLRLGSDKLVDDWTVIDDNPVPALIEADCEDLTEHAVVRSLLLKQTKGATGSLALAQQLEKQYYTAFAVVTLRLGNSSNWVYHAVCMKFPKAQMRKKLGLSAAAGEADLPALLVETTAWSTSNWRYSTPWCTPETYDAVASRIDVNTKVCAESVKAQGLYGHLCSLVIPELQLEESIGQIQVSYGGKAGAPMAAVMKSLDSITLTPIKVDAVEVNEFNEASQFLPETKLLVGGTPMTPRRPEAPKAEFVVRLVDWAKPGVSEQIKKAMGGRVTTTNVTSYGGIAGVVVTVE